MALLLKPEDCCILLIDPVRGNIERIVSDQDNQNALVSRYVLVQEAARILNVPKF